MAIYYFDSHGCKITFIARKDNALVALKRRRVPYVLPEVVELIERIEGRCGKEVALENVSCELCVHPVIIRSIFRYLQKTGLLGKEEPLPKHEADSCCVLPEMKEGWAGNIYPILRPVREEDYGKNVEPQKEENVKSQTA
jgi:hypothetical protein